MGDDGRTQGRHLGDGVPHSAPHHSRPYKYITWVLTSVANCISDKSPKSVDPLEHNLPSNSY